MATPVFVDTSAWYAIVDRADRHHQAAVDFLNTRPLLITSNFVIDETITLVRLHLGDRAAVIIGDKLWAGELALVVKVTEEDEQRAWHLFKRYSDKTFSFTDCTSFALMHRLRITRAFTFDHHFRQTGEFTLVP